VPTKKRLSVDNRKPHGTTHRSAVDWEALLARIPGGKTVVHYEVDSPIFRQGDPSDALFYIRGGKVKLSVTSEEGKEAIIAFLDADEFFGEGCLAGQPLRMATATAMEASAVTRIAKPLMARMLHDEQGVAQLFVTHLLYRNIRYEADLVDQLFNSSERRLARILLLLAHFGKESKMESVVPGNTQEALAQMIGTTRSRVNYFMNKFKKLGFIKYNGSLSVNSGLLSVLLAHDMSELTK
jgi:CRP/FNR family cyclic AMP-dependent transcriptional regulator